MRNIHFWRKIVSLEHFRVDQRMIVIFTLMTCIDDMEIAFISLERTESHKVGLIYTHLEEQAKKEIKVRAMIKKRYCNVYCQRSETR